MHRASVPGYPCVMQLRGCGTALVTPFAQDGAVDETALRNLVAWQVESGIDFLVACGTTGETPTLTHDEWLRVIDLTIEAAAGRVPIVAGATSNSTQEAVAKASEVAARPGVSAILTASPYYNKPTQEGQYRHFRAIAEAVDKPVILYNVPSRTSANLEPATLGRLCEVPNIAGVKEASGNMTQIAEVLNIVPQNFLVLSGDDSVTLPVVALGGLGVISVASNEIPREMAEMTKAALANDWHTARTLHRKYLPLMLANFIESSPLPVKAVLAMMGKIEEVYRLPLLPMRRDTRSKLQRVAADAGLVARNVPLATAPAAGEFYVYENWAAGPHKAVVHRATCGQCSSGKGRPSGHDPNHSRWHGPYASVAEAREVSHHMAGVLIRSECKCVA
jgi:4-hydroxy-tetrahydrodipicolinate synthase